MHSNLQAPVFVTKFMIKIFLLVFLLCITKTFSQSVTYFIKFKNEVVRSAIQQKIASQKVSLRIEKSSVEYTIDYFAQNLGSDDENLSRIIKVNFSSRKEADEYLALLQQQDNTIEYVQQSMVYKIEFTPNDSLLRNQWALEKIGAFEAWDITQGEDSIIVGVIDTGIDYLHPDIKNKIFINPGETGTDNSGRDKRTNNTDDDGNGFIDDFMGWDFTDRAGFPTDTTSDYVGWDNDPKDENYHGTFVAGILGAETNNSTGIAGAAPNVRILNLRVFDRNGFGEEDDAAAAILYAVQAGAKVINMSWGDYSFSYVLRDVIRYAYSRNVILVASAGNNSSSDPHYPSGYSEVISVGNTDNQDRPASNTNYGSTIDLTAPGTQILSTSPDATGYQYASGTSASAPFVSAAAALILSLQNFTNDEVKQILKSTADDLGQDGWDERNGAGRLNMSRALRILSPAKAVFNFPYQDYATTQDSLNVNVTVMSPYFVKLDLLYGEGLNPDEWTTLASDIRYQMLNQHIHTLNITQLPEGEYTLRLIVSLNNGGTTEERVNFHIQRTPPEIELISAGPVFYSNRATIMAELYTSSLAVVRMYYRKKGTTDFDFVTLDGFATNNQFVKQEHYGILPKNIATDGIYEIYFEAENLAGLKTVLLDENNNYFEFITRQINGQAYVNQLPFSLPQGTIYENPVSFLSDDSTEILFDTFYEKPDSFSISYALYQFSNGEFVKKDSTVDKIPVANGDYNSNGREDLVSLFYPYTYIDEQSSPSSFVLQNKLKAQNSGDTSFYPVLITDLNNDNITELYSNYFSTRTVVYRINNNLTASATGDTLSNYSFIDSYDRSLGSAVNTISRTSVVAADLNGDGAKELWMADYDGDLISFRPSGSGYARGDSLIEKFFQVGSGKILSSGDYDGDGTDEIAVLYKSGGIAKYFFLRIFNFNNNTLNILYEEAFLDQSVEYFGINFGEYYRSLRFVDLDNDGADELVLNIFPYLYIIQHPLSPRDRGQIIFFEEQINTEFLFAGDLNRNGVKEIAVQHPGGYKFYEFAPAVKPGIPVYFSGFSRDSVSIILQWKSSEEEFLIYKGNSEDELMLYDSTSAQEYIDTDIIPGKNYYYAVKAVSRFREIPVSDFSAIIEVYSHTPAKAVRAENNSPQSVQVYFSDRIKNTIENLQAFEIPGIGIPNSVSASSQYSYLLSFRENIPNGENQVVIKGLHDYYGSPMGTDTLSFIAATSELNDEFFVNSHEIINPYRIKIVFNSTVDETSVADVSNYIFEPVNRVASVTVDQQDKRIIYLDLPKEKPVGAIGREYRLKIENVVSSTGIRINQGAGGYLVLTSYAQNLADVYVYPSPVKLFNGNEKMMFANLPQKASILILTLEGKQIITIEEKDGNGGVEYDLRDDSGRLLSSGIYIYRIVRLDENNNEVEEKIGKFAVIR